MCAENNLYRYYNRSIYLRLFLIVIVLSIVGLLAYWFEININKIELWIKSLGSLAPVAFILLFVIGTPFFLSVDALCLAAGVLFSLKAGVIFIFISTYLSASVIFILGRYFFKDKVNLIINKYPKLQHLDKILRKDGFKVVLLLRLLPLPFALLSYALSVTHIKFKDYILSVTGVLVYNFSLVYFGYAAKHFASLGDSVNGNNSLTYVVFVIGAIILLSITVQVAKNMMSELAPEFINIQENNDEC